MTTTLTDIIRGYRELANFFEAHTDVLPQDGAGYGVTQNSIPVSTKDDLVAIVKLGGKWEKTGWDNYFFVQRQFSGGVTVWMAMDRKQLCERIVTGKRTIPAQPEREIEEVKWRCADTILDELKTTHWR